MGVRASLLCAIAACGRIDFDPTSSAGLVTCYLMDDDPSGGVVLATTSAYDATCAACPVASAGYHGGAYTFAGAQGIELPAISSGLVGIPASTVTAWIRAQDAGQNAGFVSKPLSLANQANTYKLETTTPGTLIYETSAPGNPYQTISAPGDVLGAWHHVAATWDGTTKRLYVDGVMAASMATSIADSSLPLELGADIDTGMLHAFYKGDLDEVCFWNRPLSDAEIASLAAL